MTVEAEPPGPELEPPIRMKGIGRGRTASTSGARSTQNLKSISEWRMPPVLTTLFGATGVLGVAAPARPLLLSANDAHLLGAAHYDDPRDLAKNEQDA
jgi:hypothetical protein